MSVEFKLPWSGVGAKYTEDEVAAVVKAMGDADPLTQGRYQAEFEKKFNAYIGAKASFAVSSCTSALQLASDLIQFSAGDEVVIPGHTFCATAIPFARNGAKVKWADIDPDSRIVTAKTLEKCITNKTKAIVVVHLYGLVADMDPIMELAKKYNLIVVEDVAQAPGARYKDKKAGAIGDFGCFSFHTHKNMSTMGEGGMLTVNNDRFIPHIPGMRHNGVRAFENQERYWKPGMSNVDFDIDGLWPNNFCIGEVQCALGIKQLERLDSMNSERKKRASKIIKGLSDFPELSFQKANHEESENVFHLLVAKYDGSAYGKTADDLFEMMINTFKVKVINPYYPLYRYPIFVKSGMGDADCPVTDDYFSKIIAFPFHHWMSEDQVNYLLSSIKEALIELRG